MNKSLESLTDEELMVLYQNGQDGAFQLLYNRHSSKIYSFLKRRIREEEKVADIYQDVFLKIHKSKHLYIRSFPVLPWFFTITKSAMLDALRKEKKFDSCNADVELMSSMQSVNPAFEVASEFIQKLPDAQRTAVHLRYIEDKTFEEISNSLKISPVNVRKVISRGVLRLKELIKIKEES